MSNIMSSYLIIQRAKRDFFHVEVEFQEFPNDDEELKFSYDDLVEILTLKVDENFSKESNGIKFSITRSNSKQS